MQGDNSQTGYKVMGMAIFRQVSADRNRSPFSTGNIMDAHPVLGYSLADSGCKPVHGVHFVAGFSRLIVFFYALVMFGASTTDIVAYLACPEIFNATKENH